MNKATGLFIILFAASIFRSCENIQKFDPQLFQNINNDIHDTLSRVFGELQLPDQLQEVDRFKLLWIMHNNLNSMAQNYFKIYIDIVNASKAVNKTVNSLTTLNNVIKEMAREENDVTVYNSTDTFNLTDHMASHEASMMFMSDFTMKFDNFSIADILNKAMHISSYKANPKIVKRDKIKRHKRKRRRNLQLWRPPYSSDEENENLTRRVSHMEDAVISQFPFIASIHALGEFVCAGAILSNFAVITAASCLHFVYQSQNVLHDTKSLKCRVGSEYLNKSGQTVSAGKVTFHPSYNPMTLDNNLAIVKLKWSLNFKHKTENVMRVSYGKVEGALQKNLNKIMMIGWGDKDSIPQNDRLSVTSMDIVELKKCKSIYTERYVSSTNFCGAILKRSSPATCQRDIGSPAVIGNLLVGLVSYGPSLCAPPSTPTVYTDLATYVNWINNTLTDKLLPVPSTSDAGITTNVPVTMPVSVETTPLDIHFRQSPHLHKRQSYNDLRAQILAKAKHLFNPLRSSYPKAVNFLSFLLKKIINGNMRTTDKKKRKKKFKDELFTRVVKAIRSSEEYAFKRPERFNYDYLDDGEPESTKYAIALPKKTKKTALHKAMVKSNENYHSEQMETEDFSLIQNEGLSISIETTKKTTFTRAQMTTASETRPQKSSKEEDTKSMKNYKNENSMGISKSKKKIKNFKGLQQIVQKEVISKQEEKLRHKKEIKKGQQKEQKQTKKESEEENDEKEKEEEEEEEEEEEDDDDDDDDDEDDDDDDEEDTKAEIEKIIEEIKHKKKKKSSGHPSSVSKDDKPASIRKLIEEILRKKEKAKKPKSQVSIKRSEETHINYNVNKEDESSEEDEEREAENDKTTTVTNNNTPKLKTQKKTEENNKNIGKIKDSSETVIENEVKKTFEHAVHNQTSSHKKAIELRITKMASEEVLDKNFKLNVFKKGRKFKNTTPYMLTSVKIKPPKTTRKRIEFKVREQAVTKHVALQDENMFTDIADSIDSYNSGSSKETTFTLPRQLIEANDMAFIPYFDTDDESPMLLPPAMADFQKATKDRLIGKLEPNLSALEAEPVFDYEFSVNNANKLKTRGGITIDDLNINMGIPGELSKRPFRRRMSSTDSSLEKFIKAMNNQPMSSI